MIRERSRPVFLCIEMMIEARRPKGTSMKLTFLNASRSYNPVQGSVRFTGHFAIFEITFDLDQRALIRMNRNVATDEASLLGVFDANRPRIEAVANTVYWRTRKDYCQLSAQDF